MVKCTDFRIVCQTDKLTETDKTEHLTSLRTCACGVAIKYVQFKTFWNVFSLLGAKYSQPKELQGYSARDPPTFCAIKLPVEELQYFLCISSATLCSFIRCRALTTASHEGFLALRSQRSSISFFNRSLLPRWSCSIARNWWPSKPSFTPSECQSTELNSFERSCRVGVAEAVGEEADGYN